MKEKTVTAAILERDGCVLLAQRPAGDPLALMWEFPGGTVEQGETPEECLRREMQEELGIHVEVAAFFGENRHRYDHGEIRLKAYRVRWISGRMRPAVHAAVRWVPIGELPGYEVAPADVPFVARLLRETGPA
ncbi:(deoxy)nucleoside triphosphate pyrophosphohydrolase [Desulfosoma sp.]|uniref:8-oxo-dGTP diphosphatase n=1 Tax=Desulfacinum infernum TaxID=35837 RepID=A0A831ZSC9_9BACT